MCHQGNDIKPVVLTTEEEGVALLAGAWLGGDRGALLMQSSGVGNCINMLSLTRVCRMPLLLLVTMRGQWGEFNPWQVPMGQNTNRALIAAGVLTFPVEDKERVKETVEAAAKMAFEGPTGAAVLISQRILGAKAFGR
jgi:sulfopyruvate decarboxylase TPP-binding subunit